MCTCSIKSNWSEADNIHKEITYLSNSKTQCVQWRTISNLSNQQTSHSQSQYCSLTAGSVMVLLLHRTPSSVCMHKQFWADIILANIDRKTLLVNCMISLEVILGCYPENKQNKSATIASFPDPTQLGGVWERGYCHTASDGKLGGAWKRGYMPLCAEETRPCMTQNPPNAMVPSLEHSTAEETSLVPILLFGFLFLAVWKMMGS